MYGAVYGIMTKEELSVYDKISFVYGKWWLPLHWFTALATRSRKEGRIKDSMLLNGLLRMNLLENFCIWTTEGWEQ
ncbi:UNVERIFIED_CONTAM: Best2 [Trichonephila clavipes]